MVELDRDLEMLVMIARRANRRLAGATLELDTYSEMNHRHPAGSFALGAHLIAACGNIVLLCSNQSHDAPPGCV
jgi:hypothetical protein